MRSIISLSLPASTTREINREVRAGKFASKSEFFRHIFREWQGARMAKSFRKASRQYKEGKLPRVTKASDLWR